MVQEQATTHAFHSLMYLLVVRIFGVAWLRVWLTVYPHSRAVVLWTLRDELSTAHGAARWTRAIAFFAHLPSFASAQSEAESSPATETTGTPPEGPPPGGTPAGWRGRSLVRQLSFALVLAAAAVIALVTWLNGLTTLMDLIDDDTVTGNATSVVAVGLLFGAVPMALVYNRRWFAWTPSHRAGSDEALQIHVGWWLASAAFGLLAIILYFASFGEFMDAFDTNGLVTAQGNGGFGAGAAGRSIGMSFASAVGLAAVVAISWGPLAWVVRRRHWVGRSAIVRS
ncbi:MAG TPA: hypothetical protein QGF05_07200 [Dehalococcoidia bacterium]|nr:hypothetical protein [Dehalococcoidia bacterium]